MAGATKGTWKKGRKPPVTRPKGSKNKRTLVKEAIGLDNWEGFEQFVRTDGATKLITEIKKLKGRNYVIAYQSLLEFIKPKLARQELTGGDGKPLLPQMDLKNLSKAELQTLIALKNKLVK
ncbi:MAG TPA: hypothetical protein PK339_12525 [Flavitalea sp.]|nr:hypothetical protein [Flavitalea sp.]